MYAGLVPYDGVPEKKIETVHISVTVVFIVLACCGMVFAVVCITFNFVYRKSKYVFINMWPGYSFMKPAS